MKKSMRMSTIKKRDHLSVDEHRDKSEIITKAFLELHTFNTATSVLSFMSFGSEVNTDLINKHLINTRGFVILPKVNMKTKTMTLYKITDFEKFEMSPYGILEPIDNFYEIVDPKDLDFIVCPGVIFDSKGYRIGYGGGFYDRLLTEIKEGCQVVGIGFELQFVDQVPRASYDQAIHSLITEIKYRIFNIND